MQSQILQTPETPIYLAVYEWAGVNNQRLLVDWTALNTAQRIADIAARIRQSRRGGGSDSTAIGSAMLYAERLFQRGPSCWRYTLDLSGDGTNNVGPLPQTTRNQLEGREINGLIIALDLTYGRDERQMELMELSAYFRRRVIKGPNAFIEVAQGFDDFERAMTRKLLKETETLLIGSVRPD